jgi:hypothetical protein
MLNVRQARSRNYSHLCKVEMMQTQYLVHQQEEEENSQYYEKDILEMEGVVFDEQPPMRRAYSDMLYEQNGKAVLM